MNGIKYNRNLSVSDIVRLLFHVYTHTGMYAFELQCKIYFLLYVVEKTD